MFCFFLCDDLQSQHPIFNFTSRLKILKNVFNLCSYMLFKNQTIGECTDKAYVDIQLRIASFSQKCDLYPGTGWYVLVLTLVPDNWLNLSIDIVLWFPWYATKSTWPTDLTRNTVPHLCPAVLQQVKLRLLSKWQKGIWWQKGKCMFSGQS